MKASTSVTTTAAAHSARPRSRTRCQLTPAESRRLTQHQKRATNLYYGN